MSRLSILFIVLAPFALGGCPHTEYSRGANGVVGFSLDGTDVDWQKVLCPGGARFEVEFDQEGLRPRSSDPAVFSIEDHILVSHKAGKARLIAVQEQDGSEVDSIEVEVGTVSELEIDPGPQGIAFVAGETAEFKITAIGPDHVRLRGLGQLDLALDGVTVAHEVDVEEKIGLRAGAAGPAYVGISLGTVHTDSTLDVIEPSAIDQLRAKEGAWYDKVLHGQTLTASVEVTSQGRPVFGARCDWSVERGEMVYEYPSRDGYVAVDLKPDGDGRVRATCTIGGHAATIDQTLPPEKR